MATKKQLQDIVDTLSDWYDKSDIGPGYGALLTDDDRPFGVVVQSARSTISVWDCKWSSDDAESTPGELLRARLRYHITGAIERGEGEAIEGID